MADQQAGRTAQEARTIKVLWLIKGLGAGGAERLLVLSARYRGPEIRPSAVYLLPGKDALRGELEAAGVPVVCLRARRPWDPRWVVRLRRILHDFDVVHAHSPLAAIGARVAAATLPRRRRPGLVTTEHNVWSSHNRGTRTVDNLTARGRETHLAVSEAVRSSLPRRLRATTEVVRYGIDVGSMVEHRSRRSLARRELGVTDSDLVVGTVANLRATKGYPDLLAAARQVIAAVPTVRFVAVGQGPLADELTSARDALGLEDRFAFLGYRKDAPELMTAFDVFCLASRFEGLPIALMEALALGLPVVTTTAGGIRELVTDQRDAVLVPPGDSDRLAAALIDVLLDPERRAELAAAAAARGADLDVGAAVARVEEIYAGVATR